ncbi:mechanosensitive ion channel family protein [Desulfogranum marinum]|uniref:mechanosensitive ion channel family protein n=1 Tax=Desulfogranum marinum TaxID=453220 RepID=UPI001965A139|nr:mechanosensitive ion channel domain-containing protein [Desulfogranum marinum]MBM9513653.1 mechanosensitive ion channel [Desulfogranum marinum]
MASLTKTESIIRISSDSVEISWGDALNQLQGMKMVLFTLSSMWHWLQEHLFEIDSLYELTVIAVVVCIAIVIQKKSRGRLLKLASSESSIKSHALRRLYSSLSLVVFHLSVYVLLLLLVTMTNMLNIDDTLLTLAANLAGAWVVIRVVTSIVSNSFRVKILALLLWSISALYLGGVLGVVVRWLTIHRVDVSSLHTNMLDIIGTIFLVVFFLWLSETATKWIDRKLEAENDVSHSARQLLVFFVRAVAWFLVAAIALDLLGLDISVLTIFSGAFGLGLGFGLKNVFSNLVCGLILLVDKAVKPGDVIGLGGYWGEVKAVKSRYTTVMARDGVEHIIPNEKLITNDITNLTHSSSQVRIGIPVSVSYQTDLQKAGQILKSISMECVRVLKLPTPSVRITELGDSAINMELRIWIADPERGVGSVRTEIYEKVVQRFQAEDIDIPYPHLQLLVDR